MTKKYAVECHDLQKHFGAVCAVNHAAFSLEKGRFMALLGPSGCGKTSILRLIAGLERPDGGEIYMDGKLASGNETFLPPNYRNIGMVFQEYALFPHMTVEKNIAYGLSRDAQKKGRVAELINLVDLNGVEKRFPQELSGGQQQRVALARALAPQPHTLLLDEPFSNLDAGLRLQVREDVGHIIQEAGVSAILVTHDQDEAMSMADQIGVMLNGSIQQIGSPRQLYENPISAEVALFLGEANHLQGEAQGNHATTPLGDIPLQQARQGKVDVFIRPENLVIDASMNGTTAHIRHKRYYGNRQTLWVKLADNTTLKINTHAHDLYDIGDEVQVSVRGKGLAFAAGKCNLLVVHRGFLLRRGTYNND